MEIVLGRIGHWHNPGNGSCSAALVVDVAIGGPTTVNLVVWQSDAESERHLGVPVADPFAVSAEGAHATFHLTRDCPWSR